MSVVGMLDGRIRIRALVLASVALGVLSFIPGGASAATSPRKTSTDSLTFSGGAVDCRPQDVTKTVKVMTSDHAIDLRIDAPAIGTVIQPTSFSEQSDSPRKATVLGTRFTKRSGLFKSVEVSLRVEPAGSCTPSSSIFADDWEVDVPVTVSYRIKVKKRFDGYGGPLAGGGSHTVYEGDGIQLVFFDNFEQRTRYRACLVSSTGKRCWWRSTDSVGLGELKSTKRFKGTDQSGFVTWSVHGRVVARWRFRIKPEGV